MVHRSCRLKRKGRRVKNLCCRQRLIVLLLSASDEYIAVGSSRVDLQACKLEYSIVSPK